MHDHSVKASSGWALRNGCILCFCHLRTGLRMCFMKYRVCMTPDSTHFVHIDMPEGAHVRLCRPIRCPNVHGMCGMWQAREEMEGGGRSSKNQSGESLQLEIQEVGRVGSMHTFSFSIPASFRHVNSFGPLLQYGGSAPNV